MVGNLGNPDRDKAASLRYSQECLGDDQLIAAFDTNWIARKLVTLPAEDSLKKWRKWSGDGEQIWKEEKRLGLEGKAREALMLARLFGGAAIYIGTDQDQSEPLDPESISRGGIKYLTVLSRLELSIGDLEQDPDSEFYGSPKHYRLSRFRTENSNMLDEENIHPSRLIIYRGDLQADKWTAFGPSRGWGQSVLTSTSEAIKNAGGTFANVASLVFEANIDVIRVPDLMDNISSDVYEQNLLKRFGLAAANKGINGTLILDSLEEYERRSTSFATLPEVMREFASHCAAAADIPATRFLNKSPDGLNSTGDSDTDNYHDKLGSMQKLDIGPAMNLFDECLIRSATGSRSEDIFYTWNPLKQMDEKEEAEIAEIVCKNLKAVYDLDVFAPEEMRAIAIQSLSDTASFAYIKTIISDTESRLDI